MFNTFFKAILTLSLISGVTACGGSGSDDSDFSESYLQFYNASSNSPTTQILADDDLLGSSSYGDVTSIFTLSSGDIDIDLNWEDSDGQEITTTSFSTNLRDGFKTLVFMSGDFESPDIAEFQFERTNNEDEFFLYATSTVDNGESYDLYMAEHGTPFSSANFITTLNYLDFSETTHWDPDPDASEGAWPQDDYVIYLTAPGEQEVLFQSQEIEFSFDSDYVLAVRNTTGANENNLVIDIILNSTSIEANQNVTATSQFRVYSALANDAELDITLATNETNELQQTIAVGEMSEFSTVTFGDYQVTAQDAENPDYGFDNRLLTLNQGVSKTLIIFEDENQQLTSIEVEDSTLPQSFEHEVSIANVLPDFEEVDVYFVRQDETIESADFQVSNVDYGDLRTITLPNDFYSIVVVYEDSLGSEQLLHRTELLDFTVDDVLLVTVEADANSADGNTYRARLLQ